MIDRHSNTSIALAEEELSGLTRRDLLKAFALAAPVGLAAGTGIAVAQNDSSDATAVAEVELGHREPGGPKIADKAFELNGDIESIFAFVRDEVLYHAYPGALRGPLGSLWGLSGNSVDQAQLLSSLLNEVQVQTRLVTGALPPERAELLRQSLAIDVEAAIEHARKVNTPIRTDEVELTAEQQAAVAELTARAQELADDATRQLSDGIDLIMTALADAGVATPDLAGGLPEKEIASHVWVQYASGTEWIDLDPTFADATPGVAFAESPELIEQLPDDWFHRISFSISAETIQGGALSAKNLLSHTSVAQDLVGLSVTLIHLQPSALKGIGMAIENALVGTTQYVPHLAFAENDVVPGTDRITLVTEAGGVDIFGDPAGNDGDTVGEWLEVTLSSPDMADRVIRRNVFDRLGAELRADPEADLSDFPMAGLTDLGAGNGGEVFLPLMAIWSIVPTVGDVPSSYFEQDYSVVDLYGNFSLTPYGYAVARDGLAPQLAAAGSARSYADRPNLTAFLLTPTSLSPDNTAAELMLDVMYRGQAAVPWAKAEPEFTARVASGVLNHVAERMVLGGETQGAPIYGVGAVLEQANRQAIPLATLLPGTATAANIQISARGAALIDEALAGGYVVIVPERPVATANGEISGWWQVHAETGETFDLMETGRGSQGLEYADTVAVSVQASPAMKLLGICTAAKVFVAAALLLMIGLMGFLAGQSSSGGLTQGGQAAGMIGGAGGVGLALGGGVMGYMAC